MSLTQRDVLSYEPLPLPIIMAEPVRGGDGSGMAQSHSRRSKKLHAKGRKRLKRLIARDGASCHWCRRNFTLAEIAANPDALTVDHLVNVSECILLDGGKHANRIGNIVLACRDCNLRRAREKHRASRREICPHCGEPHPTNGQRQRCAARRRRDADPDHVYQKATLLSMVLNGVRPATVTAYAKGVIRVCSEMDRERAANGPVERETRPPRYRESP